MIALRRTLQLANTERTYDTPRFSHMLSFASARFDPHRVAASSSKNEDPRSIDEESFQMVADIGDDILLFGSGATSSAMASFRSTLGIF